MVLVTPQNKRILSACTVLLVDLHTSSALMDEGILLGIEEQIKQALILANDCENENKIQHRNILGAAVEKFLVCRLFDRFFRCGTLLPPEAVEMTVAGCSDCPSDEEYLGACVGLAHELLQYSVTRAAEVGAAQSTVAH